MARRHVHDGSTALNLCGEVVRFAKPVTITGFEWAEANCEDATGRDGWLPVEWGGVGLRVRLLGEDGQPITLRPETGGAFRVVG